MNPFVPFTSDNEVLEIGRGLIDRTLPKSAWTHAAHFASAVWLISHHGRIFAARELPGFIRAYNEVTGVANSETSGYHETITQASIRAADAFLAGSPPRPLFATCNALMASPLGKSEWLLAYWSRARLFSVEARRIWVDPDMQTFPFG
jgi:hypothetical protein